MIGRSIGKRREIDEEAGDFWSIFGENAFAVPPGGLFVSRG
jgi:hypothetical protein